MWMFVILEEILNERLEQEENFRRWFTESVNRLMVGRLLEQNKCPMILLIRNHSKVILSTKTNAFEQSLHNDAIWVVWIADNDMGLVIGKILNR